MNESNDIGAYEKAMQVQLGSSEFTIRKIEQSDAEALLGYAKSLPRHDIVYMRRNLSTQEGIEKWFRALSNGYIFAFVALQGDKVVGYSSLNLTGLDWSSHVADIRVSVSPDVRKSGLGRVLVREAFRLAVTLEIEIVRASMTPDQKGARALFEELGFQNEAIMKDHVKDLDGAYHDLLVMGVNVDAFLAQRQAYGLQ
ncbi:MAG: N-acetyltransferase family protein [Pseudohongiellaceae bacterium]